MHVAVALSLAKSIGSRSPQRTPSHDTAHRQSGAALNQSVQVVCSVTSSLAYACQCIVKAGAFLTWGRLRRCSDCRRCQWYSNIDTCPIRPFHATSLLAPRAPGTLFPTEAHMGLLFVEDDSFRMMALFLMPSPRFRGQPRQSRRGLLTSRERPPTGQ